MSVDTVEDRKRRRRRSSSKGTTKTKKISNRRLSFLWFLGATAVGVPLLAAIFYLIDKV